MNKYIILGIMVLIMTHGAPDYSNVRKGEKVYRLDDLAELAARLGSPVVYDRRGDVLWMHDFEYGLDPMQFVLYGVGTIQSLESVYVNNPPFAVKLHTGAVALAVLDVYREMSVPPNNQVGLAIRAMFRTNSDRLWLDMMSYDGSKSYQARTEIDIPNRELAVKDENGNYIVIADDLPDFTYGLTYQHLKLVADFDTHKYMRVILADKTYNITQYGLYPTNDTTTPRFLIRATSRNELGLVSDIYLDTIIVTTGEE
jgi:hypothetical protein